MCNEEQPWIAKEAAVQAREWVEDFFGDKKSPCREVEEMWGWIHEDYEEKPPLREEVYTSLMFAVRDVLVQRVTIPDIPELIRQRLCRTMQHYKDRRVVPALLEKYRRELAEEGTDEVIYDAYIGAISEQYLVMVEQLNTK